MNLQIQIDYAKLPDNKVICADAKSFFATVEIVSRGLDPMKSMLAVVGDLSRRGSVVLASSHALKERYQIKTGSRLFEIPNDHNIHVVQARMGLYIDQSMRILEIVNRYAPTEAIQSYSIDEVFFTTLGTERLFGTTHDIGMSLKRAVYRELGLLLAIGIGPNKFLAKVVLDNFGKKTGISEITYSQIQRILWPLNIIDVWGIGTRMQKRLNSIGIYRLGDIAKAPLPNLKRQFGVMGEQLYMHAWGVDLSPVFVDPLADFSKRIGSGITLMRDYSKQEARTVIIELTDHLTAKLRRYKVAAYTVTLSLRYSHNVSLRSCHKAHTMYAANNLTSPFLDVLEKLLEKGTDAPIRHIGISFTNLVDESAIQLDLFDRERHMQQLRLSRTVDYITQKYGSNAIYRALSITAAGTWLDRGHKIGGHYE